MSDEPRTEQDEDAEVEGHKRATRLNEDGTEAEAEVEGHMRPQRLNEDDDAEVEGHMRPQR
jgi:hypothetical protein